MSMIIKNKAVSDDDWIVLRLAKHELAQTVSVPAGKVIVPLTVWLAQQDKLRSRSALGVWLASDERPETLSDDIDLFSVIAIDFPKFSDGRGYSIAFYLRDRLGFSGELRAIGDILRDQMFYLQRVGFNAFEPRPDRDIQDVLKGLNDFSVTYQSSIDNKLPLFRRARRHGALSEIIESD